MYNQVYHNVTAPTTLRKCVSTQYLFVSQHLSDWVHLSQAVHLADIQYSVQCLQNMCTQHSHAHYVAGDEKTHWTSYLISMPSPFWQYQSYNVNNCSPGEFAAGDKNRAALLKEQSRTCDSWSYMIVMDIVRGRKQVISELSPTTLPGRLAGNFVTRFGKTVIHEIRQPFFSLDDQFTLK